MLFSVVSGILIFSVILEIFRTSEDPGIFNSARNPEILANPRNSPTVGNPAISDDSVSSWMCKNPGICSSKWPVARAGSFIHAGAVSNSFGNLDILSDPRTLQD